MLKSFLYKNVLFLLITTNIICQKVDSNKEMDTIFYHNNLNSPVVLNIEHVKIRLAGSVKSLADLSPSKDKNNYLTRYFTYERNSRLNSPLPDADIWEVKWKSELNSSAIPWYLLYKNGRIIIQNESGWQLFDISEKNIANGIKADGEIFIDESEDIFYLNDPSGFIQAVNLITGEKEFYIYPYLGKGFERRVIFSDGNKIINSAFELPEMTHNSPIKIPDLNILETIDIGKSRETDRDGVLKSAVPKGNLIDKSGKSIIAIHDSTIVLAVQNHIYFINTDLQIKTDFIENFTPLEMSLDEEMRIYLLVQTNIEDNYKTEFWIIDPEGNLICRTEIPSIEINYLIPPAIDFTHTAYITYKDKIVAVSPSGKVLWEEYIQQPLAGIAAIKDYLFVSEGNILTAFNHNGVRKFFYNFDDELSTAPILVDNQIFVATRKHLYCLTPKK
jgi:outer membrane protein assembly factor BamB